MADETSVKSTAGVETGEQTISTRSAELQPRTYDPKTRELDVVWSTGARVRRRSFWTETEWDEELSLDTGHVRMDRLNTSGVLLNVHDGYSLSSVLGRVIPGSVRTENGKGIARVRLSDQPSDAEIVNKISSGMIPAVSVGYRVNRWDEQKGAGDGGVDLRRAIDWEPVELSAVPIPADGGAAFRSLPPTEKRIILQEDKMSEETKIITTAAATLPANLDAVRAEAIAAEAARQTEIRAIGEKLDLRAFVAPMLDDTKISVDTCRKAAFDELVKRQAGTVIHGQHTAGTIEAGTDETCKRGAAMTEYLLVRGGTPGAKMTEGAALFRSASLVDCGAECLKATGVRIEGLSKGEIARRALKMRSPYRDDLRYRGYQSTSDFPLILEATAGKTLRQAYDENPGNWMPFCSREDLPDLKDKKSLMFSESPDLELIGEGEEYKNGSFTEGRETWRLYKKGLIIPFTLEAMINDDLGAFTRVQMLQGIAARRGEADVVWAIFTANAVMADNIALFDVNTHKNFTNGGAAAPSVAEIAKGQLLLRKQKGLKDKARLNLNAKFILVPAALESTVDQLINSTVVPVTATTAITQTVKALTPIVEARLDDNSATAWYLVSDPNKIDTIHFGYLAGQNGPYTEIKEGFDIDGLEFKIRHFFGAKAIDYRGMYKSTGAA